MSLQISALELADEYEKIIDPMADNTGSWLELSVSVVTQDIVSAGGINVTNLFLWYFFMISKLYSGIKV